MLKLLILLSFALIFNLAFGQDEYFFKKIFMEGSTNKGKEEAPYKIEVTSPVYKLDLNNDGRAEGLVFIKRDGLDYLTFFKSTGEILFNARFFAKGGDGRVEKVYIKPLSKDENLILVHYYEGANKGAIFKSSARLYFIVYEKTKLSNFFMFEGPSYFIEEEKTHSYKLRGYTVNIIDLDQDGINEIVLKYKNISRVFKYKGRGEWVEL